MSMNRIAGPEDLYVGGIFVFRNSARLLEENQITHVLSVITYSLDGPVPDNVRDKIVHLSIDIDDLEDEDMLIHFPKIVRFIEGGLYGDTVALEPLDGSGPSLISVAPPRASSIPDQTHVDAITPAEPATLYAPPNAASSHLPRQRGAVLVHCAMGKSRSVTATIAYLLWKHPHRFGASDPTTSPCDAVAAALRWVRDARPGAEPNPGFMTQLGLWWAMGRPAHADDAVERHPTYRRWAYRREVEEAARVGRAPDRLRFEDEELQLEQARPDGAAGGRGKGAGGGGLAIRCKKCRRVLATRQFVLPHRVTGSNSRNSSVGTGTVSKSCPHVFIEALSWMRPVLAAGELDGRLVCPNARCGASIGRYAWQGFKCSCGEWICPAFSLQRSKVDEVTAGVDAVQVDVEARTSAGALNSQAALGIRLPPRTASAAGTVSFGGRKESL